MDAFQIRLMLSVLFVSTIAVSARSPSTPDTPNDAVDDTTPPEVLYVGNHGAYAVDEDVAIYCIASDAGSGLKENDCRAISGPAYAFSIGMNAFTARAIDAAGNAVVVTTAFEVRVTFESLRRLVDRFTRDEAIDRRLYTILVEAEGEQCALRPQGAEAGARTCSERIPQSARDDARQRALDAFDATLETERGRAIEEGDADLLIALAEYLRPST